MGIQHREDHRQPAGSQPTTARRGVPNVGATSAWISQAAAACLPYPRRPPSPGWRFAAGQKQCRWIGDFRQALARHLEHADLVGGTEAVLYRPQHTEMMAPLAFEIEHGIDQMLDRLGPGDLAILGDMAHQYQRRAGGFGEAHQIEAGGADLGDGAGRRIQRAGP